MYDNIRAMLVDLCDIQRSQVAIDKATIQDRRVAKYDTVLSGVSCWFEASTTEYKFNNQLGQFPVMRSTVYFNGGTDIKEGDRLKNLKDNSMWLVEDVMDYTSQGFHLYVMVRRHNPSMGT
jgi:hypothetical protein